MSLNAKGTDENVKCRMNFVLKISKTIIFLLLSKIRLFNLFSIFSSLLLLSKYFVSFCVLYLPNNILSPFFAELKTLSFINNRYSSILPLLGNILSLFPKE